MKRVHLYIGFVIILLSACSAQEKKGQSVQSEKPEVNQVSSVEFDASDFRNASFDDAISGTEMVISDGDWLSYEIEIPETGRYTTRISAIGADGTGVWIEDYINNTDGRTYNITGFVATKESGSNFVDGSPLKKGKHQIKVHAQGGDVALKSVNFTLLQEHLEGSEKLVQNMEGSDWTLVWSDEFEGSGLPDSTKWNYNVGNWGWGNNEPQYYTNPRIENARQEDGALIIEAHQNDMGQDWTSARLTTQGKAAFVYGKIEFRAKVPVGRGTWAAGWLLGDSYEDEMSWPYCGEIDVLECVGFEIDDSTGDGMNHASCHTRAYYFKQGNQITAQTPVKNMNAQWHTYSIEWYPNVIYALVDGERYYTYDKTADELEWPFNTPQNIILNLAVGGGWGGAKGIDESWDNHQFIVDYVRVYEKTNFETK
jgi:beta-glucanase (GH16 family)